MTAAKSPDAELFDELAYAAEVARDRYRRVIARGGSEAEALRDGLSARRFLNGVVFDYWASRTIGRDQ